MSVPEARRFRPAGDPPETELIRLARELERVASSERELRSLLNDAHEQIAARDEELDRLREERDALYREAARAHAHLSTLKRTRVWRAGATFWALRDALLRRR